MIFPKKNIPKAMVPDGKGAFVIRAVRNGMIFPFTADFFANSLKSVSFALATLL